MMADLMITESCPCGSKTDIRGYTSEVRSQIAEWRRIHKPHMRRPAVPPEPASPATEAMSS